jgi:mannose-1-phosphate guanylyltransferase
MAPDSAQSRLWGVILAGGEGKRLMPLMARLGCHGAPKQFCPILSGRSMFQESVDRAGRLVPRDRLLAILTRRHRPWAFAQLRALQPENVLVQPENRETAPGILFPALVVAHRDPEATIAFLPSDHFIGQEERFLDHLREATRLVEADPDLLILLGIAPEGPETDYGWIEPGEILTGGGGLGLFRIRGFWEKPDAATAAALYRAGCLWNCFVLIGKVRRLVTLFQRYLPGVYRPFARAGVASGGLASPGRLDRLYRNLPISNISRDLLAKVPRQLAVLSVWGVSWSDWGSEERVVETLERLGRVQELRQRIEEGESACLLSASA